MIGENSNDSQKRTDIFTIVGCGESAKNWIPNGYSIGVNDCWRYGQPTDALVIVNRPEQFTKERLEVITASKPEVFYSWKANWSQHFPEWRQLRLHNWYGTLHSSPRSDGPHAYYYNSSPIIAITLAYNLGAKDIILWGVDMRTHHLFNEKNPQTKKEVGVYLEVFEALKEKGVNVWLGTNGSVFDESLKLYEQREILKPEKILS